MTSLGAESTEPTDDAAPAGDPASVSTPTFVWALALAAAVAVLVANASGIATGDDGVGYRAMADSLARGDGYGYFLEDPVTVWPPVWPALMALISWATPLSTLGAAVVLNALTAFGAVLAGHRLLRTVVTDERLVLLGTAVFALGPSTIGLGHVLMTDLAFALVCLVWMSTLIRFHRTGSHVALLSAAALAWLGFGLRYVGLVLIAFGGLWLLLDSRRSLLERARNGVLYGVAASIVPLAWMLRNRSIDGTFTGERNPSARGLVDNGFDVAATLGRFLLPGLGNAFTKIWAAVGIMVLGVAMWVAWSILRTPPIGAAGAAGGAGGAERRLSPGQVAARVFTMLGTPVGLLFLFPTLYLLYMLYVRTTTALNQLDLRLLYPAYFPLLILALVLIDRSRRLGDDSPSWWSVGWRGAHVWAAANVAAGLVGMVAFAAGHPYFDGNYESDTFAEVRANPVLESVPDGCTLYSNLPNALYPRLEASWSPERRALESSREVPDLEEITLTLDDTTSCLIWIDEQPTYGHLWTLEQLEERLELIPLGSHGSVTVYSMNAPR